MAKTEETKTERYRRAAALIAQGSRVIDACKNADLSISEYYMEKNGEHDGDEDAPAPRARRTHGDVEGRAEKIQAEIHKGTSQTSACKMHGMNPQTYTKYMKSQAQSTPAISHVHLPERLVKRAQQVPVVMERPRGTGLLAGKTIIMITDTADLSSVIKEIF